MYLACLIEWIRDQKTYPTSTKCVRPDYKTLAVLVLSFIYVNVLTEMKYYLQRFLISLSYVKMTFPIWRICHNLMRTKSTLFLLVITDTDPRNNR